MTREYWPFGIVSETLTLSISLSLNTMMLLLLATFANVGYTADSISEAIIARSDLGGDSAVMKDILLEVGNPVSIWFYQNQGWVSPTWTEVILVPLSLSLYVVMIHWSWHRFFKQFYRTWRGDYETA